MAKALAVGQDQKERRVVVEKMAGKAAQASMVKRAPQVLSDSMAVLGQMAKREIGAVMAPMGSVATMAGREREEMRDYQVLELLDRLDKRVNQELTVLWETEVQMVQMATMEPKVQRELPEILELVALMATEVLKAIVEKQGPQAYKGTLGKLDLGHKA